MGSDSGLTFGSDWGSISGSDLGADLGPDLGSDSGPRSASVWGPLGGPFRAPPNRANFDFGPPLMKNMKGKDPKIKKTSKRGVLGGARIGLQKDPPRGSDLGSDLGSSSGPRSGSIWGPSGVPFGAPKGASFSEPEKLLKRYIYNAFGHFWTLEKGFKLMSREGSDLASRAPPKVSEKGVPNYRKRCNYNTFAISGGPFGGRF